MRLIVPFLLKMSEKPEKKLTPLEIMKNAKAAKDAAAKDAAAKDAADKDAENTGKSSTALVSVSRKTETSIYKRRYHGVVKDGSEGLQLLEKVMGDFDAELEKQKLVATRLQEELETGQAEATKLSGLMEVKMKEIETIKLSVKSPKTLTAEAKARVAVLETEVYQLNLQLAICTAKNTLKLTEKQKHTDTVMYNGLQTNAAATTNIANSVGSVFNFIENSMLDSINHDSKRDLTTEPVAAITADPKNRERELPRRAYIDESKRTPEDNENLQKIFYICDSGNSLDTENVDALINLLQIRYPKVKSGEWMQHPCDGGEVDYDHVKPLSEMASAYLIEIQDKLIQQDERNKQIQQDERNKQIQQDEVFLMSAHCCRYCYIIKKEKVKQAQAIGASKHQHKQDKSMSRLEIMSRKSKKPQAPSS